MNGKKYGRADVRDAHPGCVVPKKGLRTDMCLERSGKAGMLLPRTLAEAERDDVETQRMSAQAHLALCLPP